MKKNSIRYLRPENAQGVEVQEVQNSNHSFPNHTHDFHTVVLLEEGGVYCRKSSFMRKGELALFNPGVVHSGVLPHSDSCISYRVLKLESEVLQHANREFTQKDGLPEFNQVLTQDAQTAGAMRQLVNAIHCDASRLTLDTAVSRVAASLLAKHCDVHPRVPQTQEPTAVRIVREYLRENLSDKVTLDELAALAGLSRYHLLRVFRQTVGLPPHHYHIQLRIDHSRKLLRAGLPLAQIALESGFTDQSHFSNTFRRYTGATPRQYLAGS